MSGGMPLREHGLELQRVMGSALVPFLVQPGGRPYADVLTLRAE